MRVGSVFDIIGSFFDIKGVFKYRTGVFLAKERQTMDYRYSHIYKTVNKDKYRSANPFYYHIQTESPRKDYLFTEKDLEKASDRAYSNVEDLPLSTFKSCDNKYWSGFGFGFCLAAFASLIFQWFIFMIR